MSGPHAPPGVTVDGALRWDAEWRRRSWSELAGHWDLIVVGGGIVGAGILGLAAQCGVRALLLERHDFASGTSSRSSQLVHGGLRYLAGGQIGLARSAVHERDWLVTTAPGLVTTLDFLFPMYEGDRAKRLRYAAVLTAYDALAGRRQRYGLSGPDFALLAPDVHPEHLIGGLRYQEASTDDARVVLRVLREAVRRGGSALNYAHVCALLRFKNDVVGVRVRDGVTGLEAEVQAAVVINATGAWADALRAEVGSPTRMRPLRGSHLVFSSRRLPTSIGLNVAHPRDGRQITVTPWQGATLVGTTDLDHGQGLDQGVTISDEEVDYLLQALASPFRSLALSPDDIVSTWSGVRPTVSTGTAAAPKERRSHVVWTEHGLLTVTGGKLTTFRLVARDAIQTARHQVPALAHEGSSTDVLGSAPIAHPDGPSARLAGRHGAEASAMLAESHPTELQPLAGTPFTTSDLRWAAKYEGVLHLDDLMLRRTRLGLVLPHGGAEVMPTVRTICEQELLWTDARWTAEQAAYTTLILHSHGVPKSHG